jgi:hypothetical protein
MQAASNHVIHALELANGVNAKAAPPSIAPIIPTTEMVFGETDLAASISAIRVAHWVCRDAIGRRSVGA